MVAVGCFGLAVVVAVVLLVLGVWCLGLRFLVWFVLLICCFVVCFVFCGFGVVVLCILALTTVLVCIVEF